MIPRTADGFADAAISASGPPNDHPRTWNRAACRDGVLHERQQVVVAIGSRGG